VFFLILKLIIKCLHLKQITNTTNYLYITCSYIVYQIVYQGKIIYTLIMSKVWI